jgi:transmembrane sensor
MSRLSIDAMSYEKAKELLTKYKTGDCTDAEKALVERWLFQFQQNELDLSDERIDEIGQEIWLNLPKPAVKIIKGRLWLRVAAAAAILIFLSTGLYFVLKSPSQNHYAVSFKTDVAPGSNKAILTLANGSQIVLTDVKAGKIASEGGAVINKVANGEIIYDNINSSIDNSLLSFNTIVTPKGGQYHIVLADGTGVWLNAASSIKYPTTFSGDERKVEVTGEAYFEVVHNAAKPFRVVAGAQVVEDLGTHFNINAYTDEPAIKTTLLEGSVKITDKENSTLLIPGEQAIVKGGVGSEIKVLDHIDTDETVAWKNGLFQFNKASIESIMRQATRWYNVDVSYDKGIKPTKTFTGNISKNSNLSQLLDILSYTGVRFEIDGKKIIVKSE